MSAVDLATLLESRSTGGQLERLYVDHGELLQHNDFDPVLASANLTGLEAAAVLGPTGRATVQTILTDERRFDLLAAEMRGRIDRRRSLLAAYARGWNLSSADR
jgi:predicted nucleotidyltransferase